jgi:hypothetical protein
MLVHGSKGSPAVRVLVDSASMGCWLPHRNIQTGSAIGIWSISLTAHIGEIDRSQPKYAPHEIEGLRCCAVDSLDEVPLGNLSLTAQLTFHRAGGIEV